MFIRLRCCLLVKDTEVEIAPYSNSVIDGMGVY
jgi:hypothetical protein